MFFFKEMVILFGYHGFVLEPCLVLRNIFKSFHLIDTPGGFFQNFWKIFVSFLGG